MMHPPLSFLSVRSLLTKLSEISLFPTYARNQLKKLRINYYPNLDMKFARRWRLKGVEGPSAIAVSVILAMMIILYSIQGVTPNVRFSQILLDPLPRAKLPFHNITGKIVAELERNGTEPCYNQNTNSTKVIGLPNILPTNVVHKFWLESYTLAGERRCAGGDYYELDLSSPLWKSRPRSEDLLNGTYSVELLVPDSYAGDYNFSASLLFDAYHGLDYNGEAWSIAQRTVSQSLKFVNLQANTTVSSQQPAKVVESVAALQRCDARGSDFQLSEWSGRWSRPLENDSCVANSEARYAHCFSSEANPCRIPSWCSGNVSSLESLGWSYSAHCAFHVFEAQEAWDCLAGRWLFFWGDSNHQDTIRNLLTFVLGIEPPPGRELKNFGIDRSYQNFFRNPSNLSQELRLSSHFNGHPMVDSNGIGLASLQNPHYRRYVSRFFSGTFYPDTVIMNSGLHDGLHHHNIQSFTNSVDMAMEYWHDIFSNVSEKAPELVYRTTVAPAGIARGSQSNPQKMEAYNRIMTEQVQKWFTEVKIVDEFDMSFPFHFDNRYSDGGHYGRPPDPWQVHFYFVDVMLAHVLLNSICPRT